MVSYSDLRTHSHVSIVGSVMVNIHVLGYSIQNTSALVINLKPSFLHLLPPADQDTIDDEDTYEEAVQDLKAEWKKGRKSRSQAKMKDLMSKTGPMRRKCITEVRPLVSDVLLKFPCLTQSRVVRTEMHMIMVMSVIMIASSLWQLRREFYLVAGLDDKSALKDLWPDWMTKVTDLAKVESSRPAINKFLQEMECIDDSVDNKSGMC